MSHSTVHLNILLVICVVLGGCRKDREETTGHTDKPVIYAVNYPLAYFAGRIAGDQATVSFPDIPGDPAYWVLSPEQIAAFQNADLILLNGASYAKWVSQASLPESRLLNTTSRFRNQYIMVETEISHSHGPGGDHSHGNTAFTTWLDLSLAVEQAAAIESRLGLSQSGFKELKADLLKLDKEWEATFDQLSGQPLLGSHPVYQYLARRYDLSLKSLHWEPDVEPDSSMWDELVFLSGQHPAKFMLWESQPLPATEARLLQLGIKSIVFNPCGNRPDKGDFLSVMQENLVNLKSAISPEEI